MTYCSWQPPASLSYLHRFPIDTLKLDQSFVSQISAESGAPIVAGIVGMARSLKLGVVAEGVETAPQLAFLRGLRCDEAQGYYFSHPVPPAEFAAYVRQRAIALTHGAGAHSGSPSLRQLPRFSG